MNIYSKKQGWKLLLAIIAVIIVVVSLWYTNSLVGRIAEEEKQQVKLWAEAIQNKANLVNYTSELFKQLTTEERKRIEIWAEANKRIASSNNDDLTFYLDIISSNTTIPVIVVDENENIINSRNFSEAIEQNPEKLQEEFEKIKQKYPPIDLAIHISKGFTINQKLYYTDSKIFNELKHVLDDLIKSFISEIVINSASVPVIYTDSTKANVIEYGNLSEKKLAQGFQAIIEEMSLENQPLEVVIGNNSKSYIFYQDSDLLKQLKFYPYIQFVIIGLFLLIAYYLFSTSRKAEQNQVWVGMAKETAHQLGTPLSSLIAWVEYLKEKDLDPNTVAELSKDINRLEMITDRFSKIGSVPKLELQPLKKITVESVNYLKSRISSKVAINVSINEDVYAKLNPSLFSWVLENLIKNAVDAMSGNGEITITVTDQTQFVYIDIADTGKGVPRSKQKTIFEPGFTTKQRGWGLGLSLVKRIIENYHSGKIFVKHTDPTGTTFRIVLNK